LNLADPISIKLAPRRCLLGSNPPRCNLSPEVIFSADRRPRHAAQKRDLTDVRQAVGNWSLKKAFGPEPEWGAGSQALVAVAAVAVLFAGSRGYANILSTSATVRPNNSLLVDVQVTTGATVEHVFITYQTAGVDPLVSRLTQVSATGSATITIGRLRANRT
jgi:hypothetical protein